VEWIAMVEPGAGDVPRPDRRTFERAQRAAAGEDAGLRSSLAALSRLETGQMTLMQALTRVAALAVRAVPGAGGAGLTLLAAGRADVMVASDEFVAAVDAIQYGIGAGPCITAVEQARTVRSGSLDTDARWPQFGPQAGHIGVHSALSLPLVTAGGVLGALNVYAHATDAFDEHAARLGELFAVPAALAVANAHLLVQTERLARQLQSALTTRPVVDQALGILRGRIGPGEASERLRETSRRENRNLAAVAHSVVDEAVRRAHAHHAGPEATGHDRP
jgi:GAF domain-containing protein